MQTKQFYKDGLWKQIVNHQQFDLGKRELAALIQFLPTVASHHREIKNIIHLAIGDGREIPHFLKAFPNVKSYLINDIVPETLEHIRLVMKQQSPSINFQTILGDIEIPYTISAMRENVSGATFFVLTGNSVIFSNRKVDQNTFQAMKKSDLFLLTLEMPHDRMFESYLIEPVLKLLSRSGAEVTKENVRVWYDKNEQCMKMECEGNVLLSSYKPTPDQLRERMIGSGFEEVVLQEYPDLHMIGSLWKKR